MTSPLISIIIPTFNSANTISRCMESIVCQLFTNYEVVVVDGNSRDNTLSLVNKYLTQIPILKIISEHDNGIYDAMNKGIGLSKGTYLYFLGSDDYFYNENVLQKISSFLSKETFDCVYGNVWIKDRNQIHMGQINRMNLFRKNISHQSMFVKKSVFVELGLFDIQYKVLADLDFNLKMFFSNKKISYIDLIITNFSIGGLSSILDSSHEKERNIILNKHKSKFTTSLWIEFIIYGVKFRINKILKWL